jgi:hypothetical protein
MAQTTVVLMCGVGSFLVGGDAVVIPCEHPANPSAQSAPAIVVPRIKAHRVESVKPNMTEEGAGTKHREEAGQGKGGAGKDQQHPASAKGSEQDHKGSPSINGSEQQHRGPSSTNGGEQQHQR